MAFLTDYPDLSAGKRTLSRDEYLCRAAEFAADKRHTRKVSDADVRLLRADRKRRREILDDLAQTKTVEQWAEILGVSKACVEKIMDGVTYKDVR